MRVRGDQGNQKKVWKVAGAEIVEVIVAEREDGREAGRPAKGWPGKEEAELAGKGDGGAVAKSQLLVGTDAESE